MPVNTDLLAKIALNTVALILVTVETMPATHWKRFQRFDVLLRTSAEADPDRVKLTPHFGSTGIGVALL
jgi:hypothetical protein